MKKIITLILLIAVLSVTLVACVGCGTTADGKPKIVVTIFPVYDWVMNVLGDRADDYSVTLLLDSGADLHSYQPSVADMVAVAESDLFLYVGGESDDWVDDALKNTKNKNIRTMNLLELLGDNAYEEEIVEGMEHEHEHEDEDEDEDHEHEHDHDHEEEAEYDEHVWLSLKNAAFYVNKIAQELSAVDPDDAETYKANAAAYAASLTTLDTRYAEVVAASPRDTLLFGDRFPFRYLVEDYGLKYYAAFVGCSAETNASFETIAFLAGKADALDLSVILKIESSTEDIARGIRDASQKKNQQIMVLDSLQSSTKKEYAAGRTYLAVMESNLSVLESALS
ncbi:MAG: zinc ABC transporter substrate-binding protein [Clostridia bacterium]|nr:zinc ABC transporter substrate-binding protein [Clostridia bacterium]